MPGMRSTITVAFGRFIRGWFYDWHLVLLINSNVPEPAFRAYAKQYIEGGGGSEESIGIEAEAIKQNLYRIVWSRLVDHFQTYLANLLFEILTAKPNLIQIAADAAKLRKTPVDAAGAARSIHGFGKYLTVFAALGCSLPLTQDRRATLKHAIELRNVIVHAAGVDDKGKFIKAPPGVSGTDLIPGISFEQLVNVERAVREVADEADAQAVSIFGIGGKPDRSK
jgi:hypothetical protein